MSILFSFIECNNYVIKYVVCTFCLTFIHYTQSSYINLHLKNMRQSCDNLVEFVTPHTHIYVHICISFNITTDQVSKKNNPTFFQFKQEVLNIKYSQYLFEFLILK